MKLIDEQIAIENNAHYEAKARYEKYKIKEDEAFVRNAASDRLLSLIVPRFALMLEEWWSHKTKGRGKGGSTVLQRELKAMPLDSIGFSIATIKTVITSLFQKKPIALATLAEKVWLAVHLENSYTEFKEFGKSQEGLSKQEKSDWRALSRKILDDTKDRNSYKRKQILEYARETFMNVSTEEPAERVAKGLRLINLMLQLRMSLGRGEPEVPLIQMLNIRKGRATVKIVKFSPEVFAKVNAAEMHIESSLFTSYPMVVTPTPWEGVFGGGYVTPRGRGNLPLIKSPNIKLYKDAEIGQDIYDAVNTIQDTPWAINRKIFGVMDYCMQNGLEVGKLPVGAREFKLPDRLDADEWDELTSDEKKDIILTRKAIHEEADSISSKMLSFRLKMSMARRFLKYEKIYFPHTFDFRGRIYPIASAVNPQSDKFGQAMLQFAEAKALGETGKKWLAIHGANTYGLDSESFDVRIKFTQTEEANIVATAEDPLGTRDYWSKADDPFGFLAFCCEWADMLKCKKHEDYKSRLPIKLDATSSGLQHYSAIFRDEVGAKATNLLDGERSDIYKLVADEAKTLLSQDIEDEQDEEAIQWKRSFIPCLNRDICKPATMCLPYGVTLFGATDAIADLHRDGKLKGAYLDVSPRQRMARFRYLAEIVMKGVGLVVKSAIIGMDWLKDLQKEAIKDTKTGVIGCKTLLGFPFFQQYYKSTSKRVNTFSGGVRLRLSVGRFTNEIDKVKSGSAIAPNFIHSQDATHLLKTALLAKEAGITSFSFIHDSFGVHAGDTEVFRNIIREAFVWLYEGDTFGRLRSLWEKQFRTTELPSVPSVHYGTLDIKDVLKSSYMFN